MKLQIMSEDITNELKKISEQISRPMDGNKLLSEYASRLADVEARIQKIERCLIKTTTAGKPTASDEGKAVAKFWYQEK